MENLTYAAVQRNPDLLAELVHKARRERSEAVHRLFLNALRTLFSRPPRIAPRRALQPYCG